MNEEYEDILQLVENLEPDELLKLRRQISQLLLKHRQEEEKQTFFPFWINEYSQKPIEETIKLKTKFNW